MKREEIKRTTKTTPGVEQLEEVTEDRTSPFFRTSLLERSIITVVLQKQRASQATTTGEK